RATGVATLTFRLLRKRLRGEISIEEAKRVWSLEVLSLVGVHLTVVGIVSPERPTIFVGNHLSYLDIPLLMAQAPFVSFVAKVELASWPIFGRGMREAGTIFVKRESVQSRGEVKDTLLHAIRDEKKSMAVFPSGTTRLTEDKEWKPGAFRLAQDAGVPIQAFRIRYKPLRKAAFIDDDGFVAHLFSLCREGGVLAEIEFAPSEKVTDYKASLAKWQAWSREGL
ncbi:MAG: lysophospholipid acyltransferase family protein, partial [Bdellovibrionota bacterium]